MWTTLFAIEQVAVASCCERDIGTLGILKRGEFLVGERPLACQGGYVLQRYLLKSYYGYIESYSTHDCSYENTKIKLVVLIICKELLIFL